MYVRVYVPLTKIILYFALIYVVSFLCLYCESYYRHYVTPYYFSS